MGFFYPNWINHREKKDVPPAAGAGYIQQQAPSKKLDLLVSKLLAGKQLSPSLFRIALLLSLPLN
jgi:hypothetical protein